MFKIGQKVKYVGHLKGCTSCEGNPPDGMWADRVGKTATFVGTRAKDDETVKVHFDDEDVPCFAYLAHLDKP